MHGIQITKDHFTVTKDKITQRTPCELSSQKNTITLKQIQKLHALIADLQSENTLLKKKEPKNNLPKLCLPPAIRHQEKPSSQLVQ